MTKSPALAICFVLVTSFAHADENLSITGPLELLNEEIFDTLDDVRRKLALWRYDYNIVRPHSSLGNQTPVEARRVLEKFDVSAHDALAQTNHEEYEIQTCKLSL